MKRIFYIIAFALAVITGCQKEETPKSLTERICGEWKLVAPVEAIVYLSFNSDNTFNEYQKLDNGVFELRNGTWELAGNVLTGQYNDGEEWSSAYIVKEENGILALTSQEEDGIEYTYESRQIPDIVRESATPVVKSSATLAL